MLLKRIIPCLDVDRGRVVKGVRYVDHVDAGDPVEVARRYDAQEADEITFLDITASHEERGILLDVVARTAETVFMPLCVGGGVRSLADVRDLLNAGADNLGDDRGRENPIDRRGRREDRAARMVLAMTPKNRRLPAFGARAAERSSSHGDAPGEARTSRWTSTREPPDGNDAVAGAAHGEGRRRRDLLTSNDRDGTRSATT